MPKSALVISFHIMLAMAGATISGSINVTLSRLVTSVRRHSSSAMPSPSSSSSPTVSTV